MTLSQLPTEILLQIAFHLRPSSIVAMSYVCRQFRYNMGISITELLGDAQYLRYGVSRSPSANSFSHDHLQPPQISLSETRYTIKHPERLELLRMLENDDLIPPSRAICSSCGTTHPVSTFSKTALRQESRLRQCLGGEGRIWICPHASINFDRTKTHGSPRLVHKCHRECSVETFFEYPALVTKWQLIHDIGGSALPKALVSMTLSCLNAYICPHWQLKDEFVLDHYDESCKRMLLDCSGLSKLPECDCHTCKWQTKDLPECDCHPCKWQTKDCPFCTARILFAVETDEFKRRTLCVMVLRELGHYRGITDPAWIAQLHYPRDFEVLKSAWDSTLKECEFKLVSSRNERTASSAHKRGKHSSHWHKPKSRKRHIHTLRR